jgi:hypothetical protein
MGGTFPALIWASVISAWEEIQANHAAEKGARKASREAGEGELGESETYVPPVETEAAPESEEEAEAAPEVEATPEVEAAPEEAPEAAPEAAPESGGGGGGVTAG